MKKGKLIYLLKLLKQQLPQKRKKNVRILIDLDPRAQKFARLIKKGTKELYF